MLKKILSILLIVVLLPLHVFAGEPEKKAFLVKKVEFFQEEKKIDFPKAGDSLDLVLTFESPFFKHQDLAKEKDLQVIHDKKNFEGEEKAELKILSKEGDPLKIQAQFKGLRYSGLDQSFQYELQAKLKQLVKQKEKLNLKELVNKKPGGATPGETVVEISEPQALFARKELKPLAPGKEAEVTLQITNTGSTTIKSPVVRLGTTPGLLFPSGNSSRMLGDIEPGQTRELSVNIKPSEKINSDKQELQMNLSFTYDSGKGLRQAQQSDKVDIPVELPKEEKGAPSIQLSYSPLTKGLSGGESFPLEVKIKNQGKVEAKDLSLSAQLEEGLLLDEKDSAKSLDKLSPGEEKTLSLGLKTWDNPGEKPLNLALRLRYSYEKGGKTQQDQVEEKVILPLEGKEKSSDSSEADTSGQASFDSGGGGEYSSGISTPKIDSAVPNLIIKKFSYGNKPIAAGETFDLSMEYGNTSKHVGVENIVVMIEPGENFAIEGASNTYYVETMGAQANQKLNLKLRALPSAKTGANSIEVTFKYEYVDNDKRSQSSLTQKLSIPIHQPDRFQISSPEIPGDATAGEEVTLTLPYVNKGKSEVSNVEAHLEGDVETISKVQNLGNFEPGKSGNISFILTPKEAGELKLNLKINYEDANQQVKTKEFPVTLQVQAAPEAPPEEEPAQEEEQSSSALKPVLYAGIPLLLVLASGLYYWKRKKMQKEDLDEEDDF